MIALYRFVTIDDEIPRQGSISSNLVLDEPPRGKDLTREKFALPETKSETKETSYVSNGFTENVCLRIPVQRDCTGEGSSGVSSRSPYQILAYINTRDIRGVPRRPCFYSIEYRQVYAVIFLFGIVDTWRASETRSKVTRRVLPANSLVQFYREMDKLTCID